MNERPEWGTAPIKCARRKCSFRGYETDLAEKPGRIAGVACRNYVCPQCGCGDYYFMSDREIANWKKTKKKIRKISDQAFTIGHYVGIDAVKEIATEFFYWWYNQPGSNTKEGFDDWWEKQSRCTECGAASIEEAEKTCVCSGDKDHCMGCDLWPETNHD